MSRPARIAPLGAVFHAYGRGNERQAIFRDDDDRLAFVRRIERLAAETGVRVHAWALMTNHFHVAIECARTPVSTFMRCLLSPYAGWFNRRHDRVGHLFQDRFGSVLCTNRRQIRAVIRYVHLNPVAAGIHATPEQCSWTGHAEIVGTGVFRVLDGAATRRFFHEDSARAIERYRRTLAGDTEAVRAIVQSGRMSPLEGGTEQSWVDRPHGEAHRRQVQDALETLARRIEREHRLPAGALAGRSQRRPTTRARAELCAVARRDLGASLVTVARFLRRDPAGLLRLQLRVFGR